MASNIQFKRGTAAALYAANPVLLRGEPGLEIDTNKIKYGNGVTPWRDLPYGNPALEVVDGGEFFAPSVPAVPGVFTPPTLDGLVLWLDANDPDYTHKVNNRLSMWEDLSETRAQFFQSNKANRPSMVNQIAEEDVVTFDGVNDAMLGNFALPAEFTLLVALRRRGSSTNGKLLTAYSANSATELVLCGTETGNSIGVSDGEDFYATQPVDDLVPAIYTLQFSEDGFSTRLNGLNTQADTMVSAAAKTVMAIGGDRVDFSADNFGGDVAEIVMYDRVLTAADLLDAENYMMERWGIVQVSHPLLEGMKAFWPLNEETGNRIDITDAEIPLTPTGAVGFEAGVVGNAANLTGAANYLTAPTSFTLTGSFSVSLWFKPDAVTGSAPQIVQNWAGGMQGQMVLGFGDEGNETGVVWAYVRTADDNYRVSAPDLEANRWYHVVLVFDQTGNKLRLYVDGVLADQVVTAGALMSTSIPLRVGVGEQTATPNTVAFLADQLGIWDRVLSAADVEMLYNDELGKEDFTADLYGDNVSLLLHMDKPANAVGGSGGADSDDPYFNDVALLLHMNGSNGSTTFTDSSANALTATVNGNAAISTGQSKFGGASGYFQSGSYIEIPDFPGIGANEDFTWEAWLYPTNVLGFKRVCTGSNGQRGSIFFWNNVFGYIGHNGSGAQDCGYPSVTVTPNQWFYGAVTRQNGVMRIFVDGALVYDCEASATCCGNTDALWVGGVQIGYEFDGYIDDLRITKGVARYTANFTPPTEAFPNPFVPGPTAALLLHFDGENGSTTFTDSSPNALTVTANGGAAISTAQSKFGGASGYFDGAGDYLLIDSSPEVELGAEDFTIELWYYALTTSSTPFPSLISKGEQWSTAADAWTIEFNSNGYLTVYLWVTGFDVSSLQPMPLNVWTHIAVVRNGDTVSLFINGQLENQITVTATIAPNANGPVVVGCGWYDRTSRFFNGYIDELRIVKGSALYTANFTPPTAAFPNPLADQYFNDVSLLLHMNGANNSTTFTDSSANGLTVTAEGDAAVTTDESKFGGACLGPRDSGGLLVRTQTGDEYPELLLDADFTIEFWFKLPSTSAHNFFAMSRWQGTGTNALAIWHHQDWPGKISIWADDYSAAAPLLETATTVEPNVWYHCVAQRSGDVFSLWLNGVKDAEISRATTITKSIVGVGCYVDGSGTLNPNNLNSYIDEMRITKGVARYTANFTPPTAAFPDQAGGGGAGPITTFIDSSKHNHELTAVGNAYLNLTDIKYGNGSGEFAGGHCTIPMSPEFAFGTGDFTVEFWGNLTYAANSAVFSIAPESEEAGTYLIGFRNDANMFGFCYDMPNFTFVSADISAYYGEWAHYAFVRLDGVLKMYVNGTQVGTANTTIDFDGGTQTTAVIGRRWVDVDDHYLDGLIDDLRITKGVARYIANFNPPTKAFPDPVLVAPPAPTGDQYAENVTLLLHMDGANGSTTFTDNSYLQNTVTAEGAAISTAQSKWGGSSGYFNLGDYLIAPYAVADFGVQDFTVEGWIYLISKDADFPTVFSNYEAFGSSALMLFAGIGAGTKWVISYDGNFPGLQSSTDVMYQQWTHFAVVRNANTLTLYINGVNEGSANVAGANFSGNAAAFYINAAGDNLSGTNCTGYIDDFRITKGVARYTADFIPPTEAFPNPFVPGPTAALLLHFDGENGSTTFTDSSPNALTVTANGNAQISTAQSKFGGASGLFDGAGDCLTGPASNKFVFGNGDFTIEAWFFTTEVATNHPFGGCLFDTRSAAQSFLGYALFLADDGTLTSWDQNSVANATGSGAVPFNQWVHVAVSRANGTHRIFVDGVEVLWYSSSYNHAGDELTIAGVFDFRDGSGDFKFAGYIDEFRITKGTAVYTGNFTPPTAPFTPTSAVTPTDITGCDLWLDSTGDIAESNGAILTWADKSGNGRTATPADYAPAPIVAAGDGPNGQDVVRFSGDPNVLDVSYQFNLKNSSGFVLVKHSDTMSSLSYGRFLSFQPTNGLDYDQPDGLAFSTNHTNPTGIVLYNNNISATHAVTLPLPWTLLSYTIDANGLAKLRIDGEEVDSTAFTGIAAKAGGNLYIGHGGNLLLTEALQGDIAEISLFDHALGEAALIGLERGIMKRWFPALAPPDAGTILLMHFDADTSDNSGNNVSVTNNGVTIDTITTKFGSGSAYFPAAAVSTLTTPDLPTFGFGTGDFTIEMFVKQELAGRNSVISIGTYQNGILWRLGPSTVDSLYLAYDAPGGNVWDWDTTASVPFNTWTHIALTRQNGTLRAFIDGVKVFEQTGVTVDLGESRPLMIGCGAHELGSVDAYHGHIDELRIIKGAAVYTGNFTPPTQPLPSWGAVIGSSYGANIVAAYDFTELNTATNVVPAIIGPEMRAFGLTRDAYGAVFASDRFSGTYAESTISVNYPHTIVMVARLDIATLPECNLMSAWSSLGFSALPVVSLFSRTMDTGILPYNGQDGQRTNFMPNSTEFTFIAASFLNDGTVRVAIRSPSGGVDIVLSAPTGQANFNGYPAVGPWFGDLTRGYSPVGTYRLTMYINQGFATVSAMNALFADIAAGPASDITF